MGIFNIQKAGGSNKPPKNQKFINPSMGDMPLENNRSSNVIAPGMQQNNNETFVYNSVPKQDVYNQGMNNQYPNQQNMNQQMNSVLGQQYNQQMVGNSNQPVNNGIQSNMVNMPSDMPAVVEDIESLDIMEDTPKEVALDPLNNANNPIPVNPIAPEVEKIVEDELPENVKANIFSVIEMMIGMLIKPGTTIIKNSKKYRSLNKALTVTLWVSVLSIVLCMLGRMFVGMFSVTHNSVTGASSVSLTFAGMFDLNNYISYIIVAVVMSFGSILVASLVYYASSFLNSKGVVMGTYFMVSSLALVPLIIGVLVLYPIAAIFSAYLGLLIFIFALLYTLISFFIGMNEILKFADIDRRILYNVINLSIIFVVIVGIFMLLFRLNVLIPPEFYF